ncbi:SPOSA6832_02070, partial [Sporobolomyces salmonicolor]
MDLYSQRLAEYFAFAYVLRKVVFPVLKSLFENFVVYPFFHRPLATWITDMFYFCLAYTAIGLAGLIGALFEIQLLLWPYVVYLVVAWSASERCLVYLRVTDLFRLNRALNAKKAYEVLESVLAEEDDLNKAWQAHFFPRCHQTNSNIAAGLFGGNCDGMFSKIKEYSYAVRSVSHLSRKGL